MNYVYTGNDTGVYNALKKARTLVDDGLIEDIIKEVEKIGNLFWGALFFFILCPLGLFFIFLIPELIVEDIVIGLNLIKKFEFLRGLVIVLRPLWIGLFLYLNLTLLVFSDEIVDRIVRWFSDR